MSLDINSPRALGCGEVEHGAENVANVLPHRRGTSRTATICAVLVER